MLSKAQQDINIQTDHKTAIIYNIAELGTFIVEMHINSESSFLTTGQDNSQFSNITLAKSAALDAGAEIIYEAIETIHEGVGIDESPTSRFIYHQLPISS